MGDTNIFHKLNKLKTNSGLKRKSFILLWRQSFKRLRAGHNGDYECHTNLKIHFLNYYLHLAGLVTGYFPRNTQPHTQLRQYFYVSKQVSKHVPVESDQSAQNTTEHSVMLFVNSQLLWLPFAELSHNKSSRHLSTLWFRIPASRPEDLTDGAATMGGSDCQTIWPELDRRIRLPPVGGWIFPSRLYQQAEWSMEENRAMFCRHKNWRGS
jgi:hypothetical protein